MQVVFCSLVSILHQVQLLHGSLTKEQLFLLSKTANYEIAFDRCKGTKTKFVTIEDNETNKLVLDFAKEKGLSNYWIDANDQRTEKVWEHHNGTKIVYTNWQPNEPDNSTDRNCAYSSVGDKGMWNDISCDSELPVICYIEILPATLRNDQLVLVSDSAKNYEAFNLCKERNLSLVKIQSDKSNDVVSQFASEMNIREYWIDANDKRTEKDFKYYDGTRLIYTNWDSGQPNNDEDGNCVYASSYNNGRWNDYDCNSKFSVICYTDVVPASLKKDQLHLLSRTATNAVAFSLCKAKDLNLLKIQTLKSNTIALEFAKEKGLRNYWIDANDKKYENDFVYNNGETVIYRNWTTKQPDNYNNEDCVQGLVEEDGRWDDLSCKIELPVICYADLPPESGIILKTDNLLVVSNGSTYEQAISLCKEKQMNLVKIQNEESKDVLYNFCYKKSIDNYWIDANDRRIEKYYEFDDGTQVNYTNWYSGQPSSNDYQDCVYSIYYGKWVGTSCDSQFPVICYADVLPESLLKTDQLVLLPKTASLQVAFTRCNELNMNLVKIKDERSDRVVYQFAKDNGIQHYWIDANDKETEGNWVYDDGKTLIYKNWKSSQPDNYNNEDCAHGSVMALGKWNDALCCNELSVICYIDYDC